MLQFLSSPSKLNTKLASATSIGVIGIWLVLGPTAFAGKNDPTILVEDDFNLPSGLTVMYPPPEGMSYEKFSDSFSAWSRDGQVAVTYGENLGTKGSGGITAKVVKPSGTGGFIFLSCNNVNLVTATPEDISGALKSMVISFSIKAPVGYHLSFYLTVSAASIPEELKAQGWESRFPVEDIVGTGEYEEMSIKLEDLVPAVGETFVQFLTECQKAGMGELSVDCVWQLAGDTWGEDQEFSIDNVKIVSVPQP